MPTPTEFTIQAILNRCFDPTNNRLNVSIGAAAQRFNSSVLLTFGTTDGTDADVYYDGTNFIIDVNSGDLNIVIAGGDVNFQQATTLITTAGDLVLSPAGDVDFNNKTLKGIGTLRSQNGSDLWIAGNEVNTEATARQVVILTLDPAGDALSTVALAVPTATPTTPFWAQRANVTTPIAAALPASFLTFKWDSATDVVTVYVNDGGTIRSVAIGTVV